VIDEAGCRGRSLAESEVVHAVWDEVGLVYTCTDLYMTAMGRAIFGAEIVRACWARAT
jgi:hypothetical protein